MAGVLGRFARAMGLIGSLAACAAAAGEATPAGVIITNVATANYAGAHGETYAATSNAVAVAVASVSAIAVSPKETAVDPRSESYPAGTTITRTFTITNAGNVADAYTVAAATTGGGTITGIAFLTASGTVPVTIGSTTSPTLAPGASIAVQVTIATAGVAVATAFPIALTARSTNTAAVNGLVSDGGRTWALAQPGASLAGPGGAGASIAKLVNHTRTHAALPGETVTYTITFRNYGGSPATHVVLADDVPAGITALANTVAVNGASASANATLAGGRLTVQLGTLASGATDTITFDAVVSNAATAGATFVNVANVTADGISALATTPASVLVGVANIVYDGYAGSSAPVAGATLTLRDAKTHAVVALPPITSANANAGSSRATRDAFVGIPIGGLPPNLANANPYVTGADGAYSFVFDSAQLGTIVQPAQYELDISAPGFRDRRIAIAVSPDLSGLLYNATLSEIDGQQLAKPGGFELVAASVSLSEVFGLLGNLPVFAPHPLSVSKSVDRDLASGGDRLVYTVSVGGGAQLGATRIIDTLPAGVAYAPGTARVDGVPVEPARDGRVLTWTLPALTAAHTIVYACVVLPYTAAGTELVNVVDVSALGTNGMPVRASATADTRVVAGALGNRIVLTGRVFVDRAGTGRFREGDRGVGGVRVYLEDGESVTTDPLGRFTFPAVHPGQHVLRVDASSLPATVRAFHDRAFDSTRSLLRLVHGVYDAGLMDDVNFAVEAAT